MKRLLATAAVAAALLSGCSAPYTDGASSTSEAAAAASQAATSPESDAYTASAPEPVEPVRQSAPPAAKSSLEILKELMFETVSAKYGILGVPLDRAAYDSLTELICQDMRQGGPGYYTTGDVSALSESSRQSLARSTWLVMAVSCYPKDFRLSDSDLNEITDLLADLSPEYERRLEAAGVSTSSSPLNSTAQGYVGSGSTTYGSGGTQYGSGYTSGRTGTDASRSYGSSGSGYTVQCSDGSFSSSGGKRGACSWHGGVSR